MNNETKNVVENIRRGFQCGHWGEDCCGTCGGFDKCLACRNALKLVIATLKVNEVA